MSDALNKVSQSIKDLGLAIQTAITYDDDGAGVLPETFVKDNLALASGSEDLTLETVNLVHNTESNLAAGLALGLGKSTEELMKTKPEVERTSASLTFGSNVIKASVDRKVMVRAPGATEEKPKYGNVSVKLDSGAAAKRGDLKKVITSINETFAASFGS